MLEKKRLPLPKDFKIEMLEPTKGTWTARVTGVSPRLSAWGVERDHPGDIALSVHFVDENFYKGR